MELDLLREGRTSPTLHLIHRPWLMQLLFFSVTLFMGWQSSQSPCSWAGFASFWSGSKPTQNKYAGAVWIGFH